MNNLTKATFLQFWLQQKYSKLSNLIKWDHVGSDFSKRYSCSYVSFAANRFLNTSIGCARPHKITSSKFAVWNSILNDWASTGWPMRKWKIANILNIVNRGASRNEIWDWGVPAEPICGTLTFVEFCHLSVMRCKCLKIVLCHKNGWASKETNSIFVSGYQKSIYRVP